MAKDFRTGYKKPTALKRLEGTFRPDRHNPGEPELPAELPDRPNWLDDDPQGAQLFDQVTEYMKHMKIATRVDGIALALLADQMSLYLYLRNEVRLKGTVIECQGTKGAVITKANPALVQMSAVFNAIFRLLREYGLTAVSRSNVSAIDDTKDDLTTFLEQG